MAGYTTLRIGSSGQDVEKLQNALINEGYNLEGGADGIYGEKTASTVRQYQRDKGLTQDGVAGNQTLGRLYGGASTSPLTSLEQAQKLLDEHLAAKPGDFSWADQGLLDEARDKWLNRPDFQYDLSKDPFYQQYRDQYMNQGQLAMLDTMGQAAALTGGYGSTYAQTAGQHAYQGYLQKLNDVVPELYGAAYDRYSAEGEDLYKQLALLDAQRQQAYGEHQDGMDEWYSYLNHLNDNVQYEQQMEYQRERDAIADAQWQQEYNLSAARAYGDGDEPKEMSYNELSNWKKEFAAARTDDELYALQEQLVLMGYEDIANSLYFEYSGKLENSSLSNLDEDLRYSGFGDAAILDDAVRDHLNLPTLPNGAKYPWQKYEWQR